jgi:transketolase
MNVMRDAFAERLFELASRDERIVLLSGDIGNRMFDRFKQAFPDRFYNCGVAEANMMGTAAGLALGGLRPVVYTIVPFVTTRCLEQIRVDICYHRQPVVIVGVGGGLAYASLGATHHACEDVALLRVLPHMQVICPADRPETRAALSAALGQSDPVYIRLGKKGEPTVHTQEPTLVIGQAIPIRAGREVMILSTGTLLPQALETADSLQAAGISTGVVSFPTVKPLDETCLETVFSQYLLVVTLEEHSIIGGLGGAVAEWLSERWWRSPTPTSRTAQLLRCGTPDAFLHEAGEQSEARQLWGLEPLQLAQKIQSALKKLSSPATLPSTK